MGIPESAYPGFVFVRTISPDGRPIAPVAEVVVLAQDALHYGMASLTSDKFVTMRLDPDHLPFSMRKMIGLDN